MAVAVVAGGGTPLIGGCIEVGEGGLPYAPLVEAFRAYFRTLSPVELGRLIGSAPADLAVLLPELERGSQASVAAITPSARARLFEHLLGVVSRIASGSPLVLVIEDLHWADAPRAMFSSSCCGISVTSGGGTLATVAVGMLGRSLLLYPAYYCLVNAAMAIHLPPASRAPPLSAFISPGARGAARRADPCESGR